MIDRQTIIDTYNRLEKEAGGIASPKCDPTTIVEDTAAELGLTFSEVRAVLLDTWTTLGAG
jgi:hypothetical protein